MGKVFIYEQITTDYGNKVIAQIEKETSNLEVHIDSPGGSVYKGFAIFNALQRKRDILSTYVDGLAYSAMSWAALAAPKGRRFMNPASQFGVHQALNPVGGNKEELQAQIESLESIDKIQVEIYHKATGLPVARIKELMRRGKPLSIDEAREFGFELYEQDKIAALFNINDNQKEMNDVLKTFATFLKGDGDAPADIKAEVLKETAEALEKAESTKEQMFAEFASRTDYLEHKKGVETFVDAVLDYIKGQPNKEEIEKWIEAKANEKLVAFMAEVKTKGHIPAAHESQFAEVVKKEESFEPLNLGNKNFYDLIEQK